MALATSLAAAISWSPRCTRAALVASTLLSLSAPAWAVEQVYIWRDQSGVVRFSPVQEPEQARQDCRVDSVAACEREGNPAFVFTEADGRGTY